MSAVTEFETVPSTYLEAPPHMQRLFWNGQSACPEHYAALEADMKRAHDMAPEAARARAAYKRLARKGDGPAAELVEALRTATALSTQRYELLHANARRAPALLDDAGPADDRERLEELAERTRHLAEGCVDLQRLQV